MLRSWRFALLIGVALAAWSVSGESVGYAVVQLTVFVVLAFLFSPLAFPRSVSAAEAVAGGKPIVYWRPGCQYCLRLRLVLIGAAGRASWVNIWADPEAAAAVRAVADGNETVPTVVVDGVSRVNPGPRWVRDRLRAGPVGE